MGTRAWPPATVAALSLALLGCDSSADHAAPDDRTCWTVPADDAVDDDYWFDDSFKVSCTEPHTTETVSVHQLTNPTVAEAKEMAGRCREEVIAYLGVSPDHWVHWGVRGFLPSRQEIADGASWVRCDAVFPAWTTAAFGPPPARLLMSPWTHPRTCGRASTNTPRSPSSQSSPATSRTGTSRPGHW